jgi:hypothetical protein
MSQRPDRLTLSLGTDSERRKYALDRYVADRSISADVRPSTSEMVRRIADALDFDYPQAANLLDDLMTLAGTAHVVESETIAPLPGDVAGEGME